MKKSNYRYLISFLCLSVIITVLFAYATSCSNNNEPELAESSSQIKITEITSIYDLDSTLIAFMYEPESRVLDWPSADLNPEPEIKAYDFSDPETGVTAQISQSLIDETLLYCTFNTLNSDESKKFKVRDHENNYYTIYNENNVALITVFHNKINNTIILTAILSEQETNQLLCGIATSSVGYALGTAAALTGPFGWCFTIAWSTISFIICK